METVWYYDKSGRPAFYRVGDDAYKDGVRVYWISEGNWYSDQSGKVERAFYESGKWLFDNAGSNRFYRE